jgi:septum site-determining protein MinC
VIHEETAPFQLRGSSFTLVTLKVLDPGDPRFFPLLEERLRQAPGLFQKAPVVLDLDALPAGAELDLRGFPGALRGHGLLVVGLRGGTPQQQESALAAGLALLPPRPERSEAASGGAADRAERPGQRATRMVTEPVRSGRQVHAPNGDLVVCASVSPGAELLADGSIHVYGALRGRALAGASGDAGARIFCQSLEAELVSIAGLYLVSEDMGKDVLGRRVQVHVRDGDLRIDPLLL